MGIGKVDLDCCLCCLFSLPRVFLRVFGVLLFLLALLPISAAATQSCGGEPGWVSATISDKLRARNRGLYEAGAQTFVLDPTEFGWRIEMLDRNGQGIPIFAAPLRPVETNPTNIAGWHFRNRANSGPNTGDVNAPQRERRFAFGTMAVDPTDNPAVLSPDAPVEGFGGLGVLTISDFELTDPKPDTRAAFTSLTFSVCLIWQGGGDRLAPIVDADPGVAFEAVVATVRGCGLDTSVFKLSDRMSKGREGGQYPFLEPDMDGDNIADLVVPVTRRSDQSPGIAICLVGPEKLIMAGFDGRIGRHLDPSYFASADIWGIHTGVIHPSPEEGQPPELSSDALFFGKSDSSSAILYLKSDLSVSSYWQGD